MARLKKIMLNNDMTTETMDDELDFTASQTEKFSTDYTADKLNELYNEFDSITLDDTAIDTITKRNAEVAQVSARAKLYISAGVVIMALLLFLMVYNFFVINNMASSIDILQDDLIYQEYQVMDKANQIDNLTDSAVIVDQLKAMGYAEVSSDAISVNSNANNYEALKGESNWFDKLCEFVGSIFGG